MAGTARADEKGPNGGSADILERLGQRLITIPEAVRSAIASGHGVGKSALVAWIILWALSTRPGTRGVVAPTPRASCAPRPGPSSPSGTAWRVNRDWFAYTATALYSVQPGRDKTWRVDAITWSENNTEAIAGLHNKGRRAFALLDEASAIPDADLGDHRGRADRRRHRALLVRLRQSDAQHRPLPRMLRRRPLRPSLAGRSQVDSAIGRA